MLESIKTSRRTLSKQRQALDYQANHLDETMSLHFNEDVIVTNSSYSNGCGAGYTTIARTVDQQIFDNPTLLHVFY